jgi:hypothetical protein
MKRCPTCNLTFAEDWLSFCPQDGATLNDEAFSAHEPPPSIVAPAQPDPPAWSTPAADPPSSSPEWRPPARAEPDWVPPPPPYVQPPSKNLATASMILGLISVTIGWLCLGPIPGVAAIILGAIALSQIKKTPDRVGGKQMAWIGVLTGSLTLLIYAGLVIFNIVMAVVAN